MSIKTFKPTTPSRRQMTVSGFDGIDKKAKPEPSLTEPLKKSSGRNSYGRITVRHRGGGNKRKYRIIDFKRDKIGSATVLRLEYDPNRSANIALIQYEDGEKRYILAPLGLKAGHKIMTGPEADILPGNALPIANIPVGTVIHNIELHPGNGAQLVRSAGTAAQLMAKEGGDAQIRLPSGEVRIVRTNCYATIGQVMVIGKGGEQIEQYRLAVEKMIGKKVKLNIVEVRNPDMNAQLVAENIAQQLEKRISHRRAMKNAMARAMRAGARGIKVCCSGRLGGREIAGVEHYHEGTIPLQTIRADIEYGFTEAATTFGRIGVKVWI